MARRRSEKKPEPVARSSAGPLAARVRRLQAKLDRAVKAQRELAAEKQQLGDAVTTLEAAANRYADLYDSAPVAYVTIDQIGIIREVNRLACLLLGRQRPQLLGTPFKVALADGDRERFNEHLRVCRRGNRGVLALQLRRRDGKVFPADLLTQRAAGARESYRIAIIDGTERRSVALEVQGLLARQQVAREASAATDHFLAVLSHELRGPLTPLLAAVAAIEGPTIPEPEELKKLLALMRRNVLAEARLIDDLLDVSRITHGKVTLKREPVSLHTLAREALEMFASEIESKRLWTTLELEADVHLVQGDPGRLRQVFWNLIKNAIKFTPPGGRVSLRSWNRPEWVAVEISDSGMGMSQEEMALLFTPFQQGHTAAGTGGGLGLGLAIAKGIVSLHGGSITASSPGLGKGARFVVEIGTVGVTAPAPEKPPVKETVRPSVRPRILLVEDNLDSAEALALALTGRGYEVQLAASMASALATDLARVDLVISDLLLPDGAGWDLIRKLRLRSPVKAIALSGFGTEEDIAASIKAGFVLHLTKPIELEVLTAAIDQVITGGSQPA